MMGAGQFLPCHMVVRVHRPDEEGDQGLVEFESLGRARALLVLLTIVITSSGSVSRNALVDTAPANARRRIDSLRRDALRCATRAPSEQDTSRHGRSAASSIQTARGRSRPFPERP